MSDRYILVIADETKEMEVLSHPNSAVNGPTKAPNPVRILRERKER